MTKTVEISVQKAIDPYLKIENLGRGGGKCYDANSIILFNFKLEYLSLRILFVFIYIRKYIKLKTNQKNPIENDIL